MHIILVPLLWSGFLALVGGGSFLATLCFGRLRLFGLSIVIVNLLLGGGFLAALYFGRLQLFGLGIFVYLFLGSGFLAALGFWRLGFIDVVFLDLFFRCCLPATCLLSGGSLIFVALLLGTSSLPIGLRNINLVPVLFL